jgi:tripartite-type tricarboxylate transporter receptor subunit TctC
MACFGMSAAHADDVGGFYKSHRITILVGSGSGGDDDIYARTLAWHYPAYLPGHPEIIVKVSC